MIVKDVILVAQGEMALEEFLKQASLYPCDLIELLAMTFCRSGRRGRPMSWR